MVHNVEIIDYTMSMLANNNTRIGQKLASQFFAHLALSGIEWVEYGILASYSEGINSTVYDTTVLPYYIRENRRQNGQGLLIALDKKTRPLLSKILPKSELTADGIRIFLSYERLEQDIDYVVELAKKKYLIVLVVDEAWKYSIDNLQYILSRVPQDSIFSVVLSDVNSIMTNDELFEKMNILNSLLGENVGIGYQGSICELQIEQMVSEISGRNIFLCSTIISEDEKYNQMSTRQLAQKYLNKYSRAELEYISGLYQEKIGVKSSLKSKYLHHRIQESRCDINYYFYYEKMGLDVERCANALNCICQKGRTFFNKTDANNALYAAAKKKERLVIILYVNNHPEYVEKFLGEYLFELMCQGIMVIVLDTSQNSKVEAVVTNYTCLYYCNVRYVHLDRSLSQITYGNLQDMLDHISEYDYVWLMGNSFIKSLHTFSERLDSIFEKKVDWIVFDTTFLKNDSLVETEIDTGDVLLRKKMSSLAFLDMHIFKLETLKRALSLADVEEFIDPFFAVENVLRLWNDERLKVVLATTDLVRVSHEDISNSFFEKNNMSIWFYSWPKTVQKLFDLYVIKLNNVNDINSNGYCPYRVRELLKYRSDGELNCKFINNNAYVSPFSAHLIKKLRMVSCIPRCIAKLGVKLINYGEKKQKGILCTIIKFASQIT